MPEQSEYLVEIKCSTCNQMFSIYVVADSFAEAIESAQDSHCPLCEMGMVSCLSPDTYSLTGITF